jgi:ribosomal-protein-alanine N-acetyltransferase
MVADVGDEIAGYMVYELCKSRIWLLTMAVGSKWRRQGVGSAMVRRLQEKLSNQRRVEIVTEVRESNLGAQLFLRERGFLAVRIERGAYDVPPEDAYVMRYRIPLDDLLPDLQEENCDGV